MEYKEAKYAFADLGRLGGITYAPLKALSLGFGAAGMQRTAQGLDIAAHALPYGLLTYASLTSRGIPNETLAHKATRATALFATGSLLTASLLVPELFGASADYQANPQDTEWVEKPIEQALEESTRPFTSLTLMSTIAGIANTAAWMTLKSKFGKKEKK